MIKQITIMISMIIIVIIMINIRIDVPPPVDGGLPELTGGWPGRL